MHTYQNYQLVHEIYVLSDACDRSLLADFGLTVTEYNLLRTLVSPDGHRLTDLADQLLLVKSTITRLIDTLEQAGLVLRVEDPDDRRAQRVVLTPAGAQKRADAILAHQRSLQARMGVLNEAEQEQLQLLLDKLRLGLSAALNQAADNLKEVSRTTPTDV